VTSTQVQIADWRSRASRIGYSLFTPDIFVKTDRFVAKRLNDVEAEKNNYKAVAELNRNFR
jgi:hypothetical protein